MHNELTNGEECGKQREHCGVRQLAAIFDISNRRFQMNVRILKIPPVFDDPKVFSKGNVVFDEPSILRSLLFQMTIWTLMIQRY